MRTTARTTSVSARGYGLEIDLLFAQPGRSFQQSAVLGGIPNRQASTHSLSYRGVPLGTAETPDVPESALIQGF